MNLKKERELVQISLSYVLLKRVQRKALQARLNEIEKKLSVQKTLISE